MTEAEVVLALRTAGCVFAEDEARLLVTRARTPVELEGLLRRRVDGEPLEQILGWAEFDGLHIPVAPGVFVPRRRTVLLVAESVATAEWMPGPVVVVDVCSGSGAVAAAVAARLGRRRTDVEIHACDLEPVAVRCARATLAGVAEVHQGDLLDALPDRVHGRVAVLAASPPYVPTDAVRLMPPEARHHEPRAALDGGSDGLDIVRRIVERSAAWLRPGGHLLFDLGETQTSTALEILADAGFEVRVVVDEDLGATVVAGRRLS